MLKRQQFSSMELSGLPIKVIHMVDSGGQIVDAQEELDKFIVLLKIMKTIHYDKKPQIITEVVPRKSSHLAPLLFNNPKMNNLQQSRSQVITLSHKHRNSGDLPNSKASCEDKRKWSNRNHTLGSENSPSNPKERNSHLLKGQRNFKLQIPKQNLWERQLKKNQVRIEFPQTLLVKQVLVIEESLIAPKFASARKPRYLLPLKAIFEKKKQEDICSPFGGVTLQSNEVSIKPMLQQNFITAWTIKNWL